MKVMNTFRLFPCFLRSGRLLVVFFFWCGYPAAAQFSESFEGNDIPSGWTVINAGSDNTWEIVAGTTPARAQHGSKMVYIASNIYTAHNDYLITPAITVTAGVNDYLSFYARNASFNSGDRINVKVSTSGTAASNFTTTLAGALIPPNVWTQYGYDLSAYAGQTIYLAIQDIAPGGGATLYLDNVVNGPKSPPPAGCTSGDSYPNGTVTASPCSGTPQVITDEGYAGEYSRVALKGGVAYTFFSSVATDYITISDNASTPAVRAHGVTPVSFTPAADGTYRFYTHTNAQCGTQQRIRERTLVCGAPPAPLVNDEAAGAIDISPGITCTGHSYEIDRATAAENEPFPGCGIYAGPGSKSLWFKFTAPASGAVKITTDFAGASFDDPRMALYEAADAADYTTFTNIACDDDGGITDEGWKPVIYQAGLNGGQTYYVQVEAYHTFIEGSFCIEVQELTAEMLSTDTDCAANENTVFGSPVYSGWISLTDDNGRVIGLVKSSGSGSSSATTERLNIHTGPVRRDGAGHYYLDRNFSLHNADPGPYEVMLFFLKTELDALSLVNPAITIHTLGITRVADAACTAGFEGSPEATSAIAVTASGLAGDVAWVHFTTPSFSNFFINEAQQMLPVTLAEFSAHAAEQGIRLDWTTTNERNNRGFGIERSTDAVNFTPIGWENAAASGPLRYTFTDHLVQPGTLYYYRLRQTDFDGSSTLSEIRSVRAADAGRTVVLSPNPAKNVVDLAVPDPGAEAAVTIFDSRGLPVKKWSRLNLAETPSPLDISGLHPGVYLVRITTAEKVVTRKLVVE